MSRGHGRIQRRIVELLSADERARGEGLPLSALRPVLGPDRSNARRAIRSLIRRGDAEWVTDPETGARSAITIYRRGPGPAAYPGVVSDNAASGAPIAWGALSGLSADVGFTGSSSVKGHVADDDIFVGFKRSGFVGIHNQLSTRKTFSEIVIGFPFQFKLNTRSAESTKALSG